MPKFKNPDNSTHHELLIAGKIVGVRKQWRNGLEKKFSIHEVSQRDALEKCLVNHKPLVLLLDLALPQLDRVRGVSAIQRLSPSTNIILLTSNLNGKEAIRALKAGAKGYCNRNIDPFLLEKAVDVIQKGEIWVGRKVIPGLLEELTSIIERRQKDSLLQPDVDFDCLTPREHQVAQLVGDGLCNKDIARRLNISQRTAKAHLTAIFRKLKISDRLRLALLVTEHNRVTG
jgi:two-component system nitrate/nitrite response regulator NarL